MRLEDLGLAAWRRDDPDAPTFDEARAARIVSVDRDRYMVAGMVGTVPAEATGRLLYCADTPEDLPCVGDWVVVDYLDHQEHAIIHSVLPRRTILRRRAAGGRSDYQAIAANVDLAYVVQSCDVDFSLNRLDRYIVMAADGGIRTSLLLTKSDLVDPPQVERLIASVQTHHRVEVVVISSATGDGYDRFIQTLQKGLTYCLLGSSGVGKSTILNHLLGTDDLEVGSVREKSGKGRHTTTRRQLVVLENGALFIDTPGMRELGMMAFTDGLAEGYADIAAASPECRYADCTHTVEEGCAVLEMVRTGQLSAERYQNYLKLLKESEHYEMSLVERRKKDRAFGKMLKDHGKVDKRR